MSKKSNGEAAPGVASQDVPDIATAKEWLKNDLARSISCLQAIYSDPDLLHCVADFMLGRLINAKQASESDKQNFTKPTY